MSPSRKISITQEIFIDLSLPTLFDVHRMYSQSHCIFSCLHGFSNKGQSDGSKKTFFFTDIWLLHIFAVSLSHFAMHENGLWGELFLLTSCGFMPPHSEIHSFIFVGVLFIRSLNANIDAWLRLKEKQ
ncbi:CLUMA_CG002817, isoform A [Clunio marinus]|uniref:CLUMA_CG002817, isoform A n=1 Tax=Clunio marinus TaxID=568069 RepID=A0A1J1HLV1_9DIPT|nr:CLUMA_CG002817, isoform A [Clunio marinus]